MDALLDSLRESPLFCHLSPEVFDSFMRQGQLRRYGAGSIIVMPDDLPTEFYVIVKGSVTILLTYPDGREMIINQLGSGDFFGELAILTQSRHRQMAVVYKACELLVFSGHELNGLLEREPRFTRGLLEHMARRMLSSMEREQALAFLAAPARIARVLRVLHQANEERGFITISQEEIAGRTGVTRQTVAECLGRWRRMGWLLTGRGRIVLLDLRALDKVEQQTLS